MIEQTAVVQVERSRELRRRWMLTALVAALLLANFILRVQTWQVADWQQFTFYDPGTVLKGDELLAKRYVPTVDFGYTHGLVSLVYARAGFALLGRTPWAYLLLTLLTEMVMAWALVRILLAAGVSRKGWLVFLVALPLAIMPAYLTLTHPLEAMLILLALAEQVNGRRATALAILAACLFVKPSMAYVYGFVLLLLILIEAFRKGGGGWRQAALSLLPAAGVFAVLFAALALWVGPLPVLKTLLPLTGAKTYQVTHFGFFSESGKLFWKSQSLLDDMRSAVGVYLLAAAASALGAAWAGWRLFSGDLAERPKLGRAYELLLMAGVLNTAFLLGFYGWEKSWTYYAYLPVLGLTMAVVLLPVRRNVRRAVALAVAALLLLSYYQMIGDIYICWKTKVHTPQTGDDLWGQVDRTSDWAAALAAVGNRQTLVMTYGYLRFVPPNISMPDAWFPEPGIPTESEITRVKNQIQQSECIILTGFYGDFDLWNSPQLAPYHAQFRQAWRGNYFTVLERRDMR